MANIAGLGTIGAWIPKHRGVELAAYAASLGFDAVWVGGDPSTDEIRAYLEAIPDVPIASGIVNIWRHEPAGVAEGFAALDEEHPGRYLLGIGAGHPESTSEFTKPLGAMTSFFEGLDAAEVPVPRERRLAAALRPRMLELAAERSLGAHPYFVPVEHTERARPRLGGALLAPEVGVAIHDDKETARSWARRHAQTYLRLANYARNLLELGFTEEDLADGGSDRVIDAVVPNGPLDEVVAAVRAHLEAGADHVGVQPLGPTESLTGQLDLLAEALLRR